MRIIGITGGIATGKSTVTKILRNKGYPVICTDTLAHKAFQKKSATAKRILKTFKTLDRKKIAEIVFQNAAIRKKLEKIIHPFVIRETKKQIAILKKKKEPLIFLDVPLLFESGMNKICDVTFCIWAPQKTQIARMMLQRKMTRKDALSRIKAQMPLAQKVKKSDYVIRNVSTRSELVKKTETILPSFSLKENSNTAILSAN